MPKLLSELKKSNSLPGVILEKLAQTILDEGAKKEVKAILLKSEGEKAFCAGASFDELLAIEELEASTKFFVGFAKVLNAMRNCGKIVVVRVQGKTTGGGSRNCLWCGLLFCNTRFCIGSYRDQSGNRSFRDRSLCRKKNREISVFGNGY